ncbi:MAG: hypothetical protein EXS14_07780 [Planctomycetes bacterium]|nr:hypothetical protein [Planctomycetota bacterium]
MQERLGQSSVLFAAFAAGAAVMLAEMTAPRAVAPLFGTSWRIWVTIIAGTMLAMALGYYLAARTRPERVTLRRLATLLTASGLLAVPAAFLVAPVGRLLLPAPVPLAQLLVVDDGSRACLLVVALLFMPSAACLAAVAPICARLRETPQRDAGSAAGQVLAAGTLGSILGTLAPTYWLLDGVGVRMTLLSGTALPLLAAGCVLIAAQSPVSRKA